MFKLNLSVFISFLLSFILQILVVLLLCSKQYDLLYKNIIVSDYAITILLLNIILTSLLTFKYFLTTRTFKNNSDDSPELSIPVNSLRLERILIILSSLGSIFSAFFYKSFPIELYKLDGYNFPFNFILKRNWSKAELFSYLENLLKDDLIPIHRDILPRMRNISTMDQIEELFILLKKEHLDYLEALAELELIKANNPILFKIGSISYYTFNWCYENPMQLFGIIFTGVCVVSIIYAHWGSVTETENIQKQLDSLKNIVETQVKNMNELENISEITFKKVKALEKFSKSIIKASNNLDTALPETAKEALRALIKQNADNGLKIAEFSRALLKYEEQNQALIELVSKTSTLASQNLESINILKDLIS